MLISAVMPIMSIYKLPHGQYGYRGHVVNLPQDVASFACSLPRRPTELDVLVIRKEGASQSHHDFRVRRSKILSALQWLTANNTYYRNICIDQDALAVIPEDGDLSGLCSVIVPDLEEVPSNEDSLSDDAIDDTHLTRTFVPITPQRGTEEETIRQSIQKRLDHPQAHNSSTMMWPSISGIPINEFNTEGYIACAFPTLFPIGAADFLAPRHHKVSIGQYFKHLMMYDDGRFSKHPRFRYFALNTTMRRRALETGRIYIRQHPQDGQLSVEDLRDMVGSEGQAFSNRVLHYAASLRGTRQYWFRQRSRLIAMVDTLGLPTIFFTHSAADLQWPELLHLICPEDLECDPCSYRAALVENPALADWFFYHRIQKFIDIFYIKILGATDYWFRFEWQHRGSPHIHGLAWLSGAPNVEHILASSNLTAHAEIIQYADAIISTINPAILPDGSNAQDAPPPKTNPHVCNQSYVEVEDFHQDLVDLVATCQRHTRCSASYCLRNYQGQQKCRYGYPKPLQQQTTILTEDGEPALITARNDSLINSYNPLQLSAWRANVDIQFCISRHKVIEYCAKYATKSEPRSQSLKDIFTAIVNTLQYGNTSLKAVQKLLINSVGERDYSAQETCHLILQLPMYSASRDFVVLSLDGSRSVADNLQEGDVATAPSTIDHYIARPTTPHFNNMTLLHFAQHYAVSKELSSEPKCRKKSIIVITRPYVSPDCNGPNYEQYCHQRLMLHKPYRQEEDLLLGCDTYSHAYALFLRSSNIPPSLEEDIRRLEQHMPAQQEEDIDNEV